MQMKNHLDSLMLKLKKIQVFLGSDLSTTLFISLEQQKGKVNVLFRLNYS